MVQSEVGLDQPIEERNDMHLIDTHAHLDAEAFEKDADAVVARAHEEGVKHILTIGITLETSLAAIRVAERFPNVSAVVGVQPNYASEMKAGDWEEIVELIQHPEVVGIGETGLDRYWDYAPIETQAELFDRHLELSSTSGLPFVVHCREAEADTEKQLRAAFEKFGPLNGVMHSFCGDADMAAACVEMGMHISFAGMVTYKKNEELRQTARTVPLDRLLVETDSPYLAPRPKRGKRNEPAFVKMTAECLAEVRGISLEELAAATTANAERLFLS